MKFQVGDKVIVRHSNEEGEVVEIIDREMAMIEVRGVRFPAYMDQLDFPYFRRFTEKKPDPGKSKTYVDQIPSEKSLARTAAGDGVWLGFLPVMEEDEYGDDMVRELKVYLINHLPQAFRFSFRLTYFGKVDLELQNELLPNHEFYLLDLPFENLNDSPAFEFVFSLLSPQKEKEPTFACSVKPKPRQVFSRIEEMKSKGWASYTSLLFSEYPDRAPERESDHRPLSGTGAKVYDLSRLRQNLEPAREEVDLHIEKLTGHWQELDPFESLTLQLQAFEKWLELAIAHRLPYMVIIHGVGTGKLRDEIHEMLRARKEVKNFVNRYHARYGYGATEIFFQYVGT